MAGEALYIYNDSDQEVTAKFIFTVLENHHVNGEFKKELIQKITEKNGHLLKIMKVDILGEGKIAYQYVLSNN